MNEDGGSCVVPTEWKVAAGTRSIYRSVSRNCYLLPLSSARAGAEQVLSCAHPHNLSRSIVTTFVIGCLQSPLGAQAGSYREMLYFEVSLS